MHASATLNTTLALLLGITGTLLLSSQTAVGYPAAAVSSGVNPVVSTGGSFTDSGSAILFTATEYDLVITDLTLSMSGGDSSFCYAAFAARFTSDGGVALGEYAVGLYSPAANMPTMDATIDTHLSSGMKIPAGQSLTLTVDRRYGSGCGTPTMHYAVSGYHAQP